MISRLFHYLKMIHQELLQQLAGQIITTTMIERRLNEWLAPHTSRMETSPITPRGPRTLQRARVDVTDEGGWYGAHLRITPNRRYEGASFELSMSGRLEKPPPPSGL